MGMYVEKAPGAEEDAEPWVVEEYYFGQMNFEIFRVRGDRIQYQVEKGFKLSLKGERGHQYWAEADEVLEFIAEHQDCRFIVADSYPLHGSDRRQQPSMWLIGWRDLPADQIEVYESAKQHSFGPPKRTINDKLINETPGAES